MEALTGVLAGAVIAALGYVGKLVVESWRQLRRDQTERFARLLALQALLRASSTAYAVQRTLAGRLADKLQGPEAARSGPGLELLLTDSSGRFSPDEADEHAVIRAYTEFALRPINQSILDWLRSDIDLKTMASRTAIEPSLGAHLKQLGAHLILWLAKYEAWIPDRPEHALVYLADEKAHGLGFPIGIDKEVDDLVVERQRRSWWGMG